MGDHLTFSPLLIEEGTATGAEIADHRDAKTFQSSTYRGRHCNDYQEGREEADTDDFQSSTYRGRHCNC